MKQTAVEWLVEQVFGKHTYLWNDVIEKAKAMEREQIKDAYKAGFNYRDEFNWEGNSPWEDKPHFNHNEQEFQQYYNETYGGK